MKKSRVLFTVLSLCLGILMGLASWAQADFTSVYEGASLTDVSLFGNLDQSDLSIQAAFGGYGCQVVAYTNGLAYLQKAYPSIYGTSLIPNYSEMGYTAVTLGGANYLNVQVTRDGNGNIIAAGCALRDMVWGVNLYIEGNSPNHTVYEAQGIPPKDGTPGAWTLDRYQPGWVSTGDSYPTESFLYGALSTSQALVITWVQVNPETGQMVSGGKSHLLTVTGLIWNPETSKGTLYFVDPTGGAQRNSPFWQATDGSLWLDYGEYSDGSPWTGLDGQNWWFSGKTRIILGMAEGPAAAPLPPGLWLLGSGLAGLVGVRRFRKA